jgi:hypothetical protein
MSARRFNILTAVILAVSLTAMGLAAAMARGQTAIGGRVAVLCSGGGIVQIVLDPEGRPTGDSHLCPDLAASLLAALSVVAPEIARPAAPAEAATPPQPRLVSFPPRAAARARGPPVPA